MALKVSCHDYYNKRLKYKYIYVSLDDKSFIVVDIEDVNSFPPTIRYGDNPKPIMDVRKNCLSCKHGLRLVLGRCKREAKFCEMERN